MSLSASLAPYYAGLRHVHVGLVGLSVALFVLRGTGRLVGARWPLARSLRVGSVLIDCGLLAAGVALWLLLGLNPLRNTWLGAKLLLLVGYIVAGTFALKRARTGGGRVLAFVLALACVASMGAIALAHDARAPLRWLGLG